MTAGEISSGLARFVAGLRPAALPPNVVHEAKRCLVNYFAVALAGASTPTLGGLLRVLAPFSSGGPSTIIGRSESVDALSAAFLNAASANIFDFDDTHIPTIIHPAGPVASALFALSEIRPLDGATFITAFVAGIEVECQLGLALHPGHYRHGWHITSTCGVFGAAMACGRAMGLTPEQLLAALGHASAQASGLVETLGTDSKSMSVGNAAHNGLLSALWAGEGLTGPLRPLEGEFGFLRVFGDPAEGILQTLGERWEILNNTYKPYPCGVVLNPVIDACMLLRDDASFVLEKVSRVIVTGAALLSERTDRPAVRTGRESQVSAQHAVAITLLRGRPGLAEFSDAAVAAAEVGAFRKLVELRVDEQMPVGRVRVEVECGAKHRLEIVVDARDTTKGIDEDARLSAKLHSCGEGVLSRDRVDALLSSLWELNASRDTASLLRVAATTAD